MNYKHIPQDPKDLTLPGLNFKSRARRQYERAMWPHMRQDQLTLLPVEDLAPPQEYCKVGCRVFNLSRIGEWDNRTIWAFYRAVHEEGDLPNHPWVFDAMLQWQFLASDYWREMFSEDDNPSTGSTHIETLKTKFLDWAGRLTPEQEISALKEIGRLEDESQWRMLRMLIEAKQLLKTQRREYPRRPVAEDDPFWPYVRDVLKKAWDRIAEEYGGADELYEYARELLGPNGMRYYTHFMDKKSWR